jgi:hypothetical protein
MNGIVIIIIAIVTIVAVAESYIKENHLVHLQSNYQELLRRGKQDKKAYF